MSATSGGSLVPRSSWGNRRSDSVLGDSRTVRESRTYRKWESMVQRGLDRFLALHSQTFLRRLRRGAPQDFRWEIWKVLLQSKVSIPSASISRQSSTSHISSPDVHYSNSKGNQRNLTNSDRDDVFSATPSDNIAMSLTLGGLGSPLVPAPKSSGVGVSSELPNLTMSDYLALAETPSLFQGLINIDIPRTFPEIPVFDPFAQQQLSRILNAFANYRPAVGYCQGMNFVVGFLLLVSDFREFEVFSAMTILFETYSVEGLFRENFPLLSKYIEVYDAVAATTIPTLWSHFNDEGVLPPVYLHQWFLTLYVRGLPLRTVVVIWDFVLAEGLQSLIPLTIALLRVLQRFLLRLKFEDAVKFLKSLKNSGDCDETEIGRMLVRQAEKVEISGELIEPLMNINIEELVKEAAENEQHAQAQRASHNNQKICATSLDQYETEANKPNPLLQFVSEKTPDDNDDQEYNYVLRGDVLHKFRPGNSSLKARSLNLRESPGFGTVPQAPYQQHDVSDDRIDRANTWIDPMQPRNLSTYTAFPNPSVSEAVGSGRRRSESANVILQPRRQFVRSADYRLGYPASSAWASSGCRVIPAHLQPSYHAHQSAPNLPNSDTLPSDPSQSSSSSWFPIYQSPLWRFPYGYPSPLKRQIPSGRQSANISSVAPIRYSALTSQSLTPEPTTTFSSMSPASNHLQTSNLLPLNSSKNIDLDFNELNSAFVEQAEQGEISNPNGSTNDNANETLISQLINQAASRFF